MDPRAALVTDMDTQLRQYLGQGVDVQRTLVDTRYARDVLLVCDGMSGTDLPRLSMQFREASRGLRVALPVLRAAVQPQQSPAATMTDGHDNHAAGHGGHDAGPPQGWARNTSGFGHSHPPLADFNLVHRSMESAPTTRPKDPPSRLDWPPRDEADYEFGNRLPWYSWRRWISTKRT